MFIFLKQIGWVKFLDPQQALTLHLQHPASLTSFKPSQKSASNDILEVLSFNVQMKFYNVWFILLDSRDKELVPGNQPHENKFNPTYWTHLNWLKASVGKQIDPLPLYKMRGWNIKPLRVKNTDFAQCYNENMIPTTAYQRNRIICFANWIQLSKTKNYPRGKCSFSINFLS